MKTIYKCEICGYESEDKEKIQKCEAQGKNNKFSEREKVECELGGEWRESEILKVSFETRGHKPGYDVKIIDPTMPNSDGGHVFSLEEEGRLRSIS